MARSSPSKDLYDEPFYRTFAAKCMAVLFVVGVSAWGIIKLERINERHQIELRFTSDATLGPLLGKWRDAINKNQHVKPAPGDQLPIALYFGKVLEYTETKPSFGLAPTCVLKLQDPQLLAGVPHKSDTREKVEISYKPPAPKTKPQKGQEWLVVVWRDAGGNNIVHTAYPCPAVAVK